MTPDEIKATQADAPKPPSVVVDMAGAMDKITPELMAAMAPILLSPMIQTLELDLQRKEAEIARLRDAGLWLLRRSTGETLRQHGIVLNDTSDLDEFIAARAALEAVK